MLPSSKKLYKNSKCANKRIYKQMCKFTNAHDQNSSSLPVAGAR